MKKHPEEAAENLTELRAKIVGLSESSGRKSYYPLLQEKIRQLQDEISERQRSDNALRETLERIQRQQDAIAAVATNPDVYHGLMPNAAPALTEIMAEALHVDYAGLWMLDSHRAVCVDEYVMATRSHHGGFDLNLADHPEYERAIRQGIVAAGNAFTDLRTVDFANEYLTAHGITAMLDAPVFLDGELTAIICFENAEERLWQPDELTFAGRIADQITLMLTNQSRRKAEEELRETYATLKHTLHFTESLLDAIPIPVFYKNKRSRFLGCNKSFTHFTGLSSQDLQHKTSRDLWPDIAEVCEKEDEELLRGAPPAVYEAAITGINSEKRDVIFAKQMFTDDNDKAGGIIGSFLDVTERNRSARENLRLRGVLTGIIDSMPSILIGVDAASRVTHWNLHAEQETGIPRDRALGRTLENVFPRLATEMPKIRMAIERNLPSVNAKQDRIVDGETIYEDVSIYPLVTSDSEGAVIRIDNVTERIRIEEMLIQSEKMLSVGGLAAGMAHEINNPLASIMGNAQVLENRLMQDIAQNLEAAELAGLDFGALHTYLAHRGIPGMLRAIRASGSQAAQIVANMLNFSRKGASVLVAEDLAQILEKTVQLACTDFDLKKNYDFKKIIIIREYDPSAPLAMVSANKLQQVLLNIFRNGAEAMSEKNYGAEQNARFILRVRPNPPWVRIEIEDNGPGMDQTTRKRIFEPFFTTKPVGKGTGLGLSVSYFIITEEHGGVMDAETVPGQWTRFIIDLPQSPSFA